MTKKERDFELPVELSESEIEEMVDRLYKYEVKLPSECEINQTVEMAMMHLQVKKKKSTKLKDLMTLAQLEITFFSRSYWLVSMVFYVVGMLFTRVGISPYVIMVGLGPIPFILGLVEVFKNRDSGMLELEASCKFNAASVLLSKLFVTAVYNIVLNFVASIGFIAIGKNVQILMLTMYWLVAFVVVCGLAIVVVVRIRSRNAMIYLLMTWGIVWFAAVSVPVIYELILKVSPLICVAVIIGGVIFTLYQVKQLYIRTKTYFEGNESFEINFE